MKAFNEEDLSLIKNVEGEFRELQAQCRALKFNDTNRMHELLNHAAEAVYKLRSRYHDEDSTFTGLLESAQNAIGEVKLAVDEALESVDNAEGFDFWGSIDQSNARKIKENKLRKQVGLPEKELEISLAQVEEMFNTGGMELVNEFIHALDENGNKINSRYEAPITEFVKSRIAETEQLQANEAFIDDVTYQLETLANPPEKLIQDDRGNYTVNPLYEKWSGELNELHTKLKIKALSGQKYEDNHGKLIDHEFKSTLLDNINATEQLLSEADTRFIPLEQDIESGGMPSHNKSLPDWNIRGGE